MTFTVTDTFTTFSCWNCGSKTGVLQSVFRQFTEQQEKPLHCAQCGSKNWWVEKSIEKQLIAERAAHDQTKADRDRQRAMRQATERRLSAKKGVLTKLKGRIAKGMCPCCRRHFGNLWRHMKTQHPDYQQVEE